jgi:Zn-dependent peptidase ImmA (M78 family)/transcriptional regulator with XRE-family HTH domain
MPTDLRAVGSKLRKYREQLRESVQDVSRSTGISSDRLAGMEEGSIRPTGDEILILADHWACDFGALLTHEISAPFEEAEVLYRRHGEAFSKQDRRVVQEFLYLCETEALILRELEHTPQRFSFTPKGPHYISHGEQGAFALRTFFNYESDRPSVVLDIYGDLRKIGVHIFRRKLKNSDISGLFLSNPSAGPCLLVNYSEDVYRQRFSAAHEMAHAIFDTSDQAVVSFANPGDHDRLKELRANRFASCYLMPPSMLKSLPDPSGWKEADALRWANNFRVSCDALGIALKQAGRLDDAGSRKIRSFRVPTEAKMDPELSSNLSATARNRKRGLLERGLSDFYAGLCFEAHNRGLISTGKLAEAMLTDTVELAELAALYGTSLRYGD